MTQPEYTPRSVVIPFAGFYTSIHDSELDCALEQVLSDESGRPYEGLQNHSFDAVDWKAAHEAYAKKYAEAFAKEFEIKGLEFEELVSPKEYNFTTDRVFCKVPYDELVRLHKETPADTFKKVCEANFTRRSGFIPFYSSDWTSWGHYEDWDHNQWMTVVEAYVLHKRDGEELDSMAEYDLMERERCNGGLDDCLFSGESKKLQRLDRIASYLRKRKERK